MQRYTPYFGTEKSSNIKPHILNMILPRVIPCILRNFCISIFKWLLMWNHFKWLFITFFKFWSFLYLKYVNKFVNLQWIFQISAYIFISIKMQSPLIINFVCRLLSFHYIGLYLISAIFNIIFHVFVFRTWISDTRFVLGHVGTCQIVLCILTPIFLLCDYT